jgi:hypothetical protein
VWNRSRRQLLLWIESNEHTLDTSAQSAPVVTLQHEGKARLFVAAANRATRGSTLRPVFRSL